MDTMYDVIKSNNIEFTQEDREDLNRRLLLLVQLGTLQSNVCAEIEAIFKRYGFYRFEIKHNQKRIRSLVSKGFRDFFDMITQKQIDEFCDDADDLERIVKKWAGINDTIL